MGLDEYLFPLVFVDAGAVNKTIEKVHDTTIMKNPYPGLLLLQNV